MSDPSSNPHSFSNALPGQELFADARDKDAEFNNTTSLLYLLLSNSEDIFFLLDTNLRIVLYNEIAAHKYEVFYNKPVQRGMHILDMAEPDRRPMLQKIYADVFAGYGSETMLEVTFENETRILQNVFRPAKNTDGEIVAAMVTVYDITEKEKTRKQLAESEERLRYALQGSNHGVWDWNIKTGEIFFSDSWKRMLGFEEGEITNTIGEWERRIHPEDKRQLAQDLNTHFNSDIPTYENAYRLLAKNNEYKWIEGRGKIVEWQPDGMPLRMIGTHTDITEKREFEQQYRILFDLTPLPTWIYDFETLQFLAVNQAAIKHYGFSKEEFLNMSIRTISNPTDDGEPQELVTTQHFGAVNFFPSRQHLKKNGELIIVEKNATAIMYNGRKAHLVVVNDITEKVAAEKELKQSYQLYQYVSKATSDAVYDWNIETGQVTWSDNLTKLFGYPIREMSIEKWMSLIHDDERECVVQMVTHAVFHSRKKLWRMQYKFSNSDGTYRYVVEKGFILRDSTNKPLRMIGALQDITNYKKQEQELTESNKRYEYATLAISDIIWDWNLQTNMVLWSDNYESLTGWKLPESKRLPTELCIERFHDHDRDRIVHELRHVLYETSEKVWETEMKYNLPGGSFTEIYNRSYIVRNEHGAPTRMVGAMQDITARKRLEEQLLLDELEKQKVISKATIDTQERERTEIGKELHDNVNQVLTTTKLYLELALNKAELKDDLLQKAQKNIMYVIDEIRQLSRSLMNPSLGDLGLTDSINDLIENIHATGKIKITFQAAPNIEHVIPSALNITIYRIIQEALNNAVKHAQASSVMVIMKKTPAGLELKIADNGIGFDMDTLKKGSGLKSIENRVYLANGTLHMKTTPGAGSTLIIHFAF